ncbi:MAG: helix-turn-helix transcriptional regulator [Deltaproteobacteria bacterium]|nr:helix-turn-helix transcriptional regulator [Deltaproteobacteria bacterium]MBW2396195.1 helix-turn-helix transcriptional regulator [Deltaproteobacteria bacterium]
MKRATQIWMRLGGLESNDRVLSELMERVPSGVMLIDSRGKILRSNRHADRILEQADGLRSTSDGLRATQPEENQTLQRAIGAALQTRSNPCEHLAHEAFRISSRPDADDLSVLVAPTHAQSELFGTPGAVAIVFVSNGSLAPHAKAATLRLLYDFTQAQSALALRIAAGQRLDEAAAALGIQMSTARSQLKHIFAKAGVSRQAELVHLLFTTPGIDFGDDEGA